jgi:hypothetical protein
MNLQERFQLGAEFSHCGRKCVVMRYMDEGEATHTGTVIGMKFAYADNNGQIRYDVIAEREYPAILAQNLPPGPIESLLYKKATRDGWTWESRGFDGR